MYNVQQEIKMVLSRAAIMYGSTVATIVLAAFRMGKPDGCGRNIANKNK